MIAQIPLPTGHELMSWLGSLGLVLLIADRVISVAGRVRGEKQKTEVYPQPLDVNLVHEMAKDRDCLARAAHLQSEVNKLWAARDLDAKEASIHRKSIYDKVESVRRDLTDKIESVPHQVVATLRNTKALWSGSD